MNNNIYIKYRKEKRKVKKFIFKNLFLLLYYF